MIVASMPSAAQACGMYRPSDRTIVTQQVSNHMNALRADNTHVLQQLWPNTSSATIATWLSSESSNLTWRVESTRVWHKRVALVRVRTSSSVKTFVLRNRGGEWQLSCQWTRPKAQTKQRVANAPGNPIRL